LTYKDFSDYMSSDYTDLNNLILKIAEVTKDKPINSWMDDVDDDYTHLPFSTQAPKFDSFFSEDQISFLNQLPDVGVPILTPVDLISSVELNVVKAVSVGALDVVCPYSDKVAVESFKIDTPMLMLPTIIKKHYVNLDHYIAKNYHPIVYQKYNDMYHNASNQKTVAKMDELLQLLPQLREAHKIYEPSADPYGFASSCLHNIPGVHYYVSPFDPGSVDSNMCNRLKVKFSSNFHILEKALPLEHCNWADFVLSAINSSSADHLILDISMRNNGGITKDMISKNFKNFNDKSYLQMENAYDLPFSHYNAVLYYLMKIKFLLSTANRSLSLLLKLSDPSFLKHFLILRDISFFFSSVSYFKLKSSNPLTKETYFYFHKSFDINGCSDVPFGFKINCSVYANFVASDYRDRIKRFIHLALDPKMMKFYGLSGRNILCSRSYLSFIG